MSIVRALERQFSEGIRAVLQMVRRRGVLMPLLGAIVLLGTFWATTRYFLLCNDRFQHGPVNFDESHFVWGGWCINKGLAPYRDFLEFKPPFIFLTHALALKLYGYHAFGYRTLFLWFPLASLIALQIAMISRGIDKLLSMGLVLAIVHLWLTPAYHDVSLGDSESIGLAYYFLGVAFLMMKVPWRTKFAARARDVTNLLGGAFLFACVQSKEPFLPVVGLTWISCFLTGERTGNLKVDASRYAKWTIGGAMLVVLALCIYMVPTGSMAQYLKMLRGYGHFYRDKSQSYCVVLGRFHPTTPFNDLMVQFDQARLEFLNLTILGYLVPLGIASAVFIARRSWLLLALTLAGCFFALLAVTASNCQWIHYYNMTESGLFFFLIAGLDSMSPWFRSWDGYLRNFVRLALLAGVVVTIWPRYEAEEEVYGTRTYPNEYAEQVPGVYEAITKYTMPDDRIFTTGGPILYVQANRISAVRESALVDEALGFYEGTTDEEKLSGLRAQLEKNRPKLVIMDPWLQERKGRTNRALLIPFLTANGYKKAPGSEVFWLRPDVVP